MPIVVNLDEWFKWMLQLEPTLLEKDPYLHYCKAPSVMLSTKGTPENLLKEGLKFKDCDIIISRTIEEIPHLETYILTTEKPREEEEIKNSLSKLGTI